MKKRTLKFAGIESDIPLQIGRHVTVRRQSAGWTTAVDGDVVRLVDAESGDIAYAGIKQIVYDLDMGRLASLGDISGERPAYNTGEKLCAGLGRFYGHEAPTMMFCAIEFVTYMREVKFEGVE